MGVVSHVKVLSDKLRHVSSIEALASYAGLEARGWVITIRCQSKPAMKSIILELAG